MRVKYFIELNIDEKVILDSLERHILEFNPNILQVIKGIKITKMEDAEPSLCENCNLEDWKAKRFNPNPSLCEHSSQDNQERRFADQTVSATLPVDTSKSKGCGNYMGYKHTSGVKAYCGDDVVTHIIYCEKCLKKSKSEQPKDLREYVLGEGEIPGESKESKIGDELNKDYAKTKDSEMEGEK